MTKDEINKSTDAKMKKINALMESLQITVSAETTFDGQGLLKQIVYYKDNEKYLIDEEEPKKDVPPSDIRKEKTDTSV